MRNAQGSGARIIHGKLHAGKGYDYPKLRAWLRQRGIIPCVACRGIESSTRMGRHR